MKPQLSPQDQAERRQRARIAVIGLFFAGGFFILSLRALFFHLQENEKLSRVALRQYRTAVRQSTWRGKILDRASRELAVNVSVDSIFANPQGMKDPSTYARKLSPLLDMSREKILSQLKSKRKFVWLKRRVTKKESETVSSLNLAGIATVQESKRSYPNGKLAASILGAVGFDAQALGGVELAVHDILTLQSNPGEYRRDARGHLYLSPTDYTVIRDVAQVELTIDKTLQYIAERELEVALTESGAKIGIVVVADPTTGEILAMANAPTFDPNRYNEYASHFWKNRAITDSYEPGSTLKVMVMAAALNQGILSPDAKIDCFNGRYQIGKKIIQDTHPHGILNVSDIIRVSSNIGAGRIGMMLSPEQLAQSLRDFGFGKKLEIELPGEAAGILSAASTWSDLVHMTIAFGQGISVTPLQMTMAFAAIANGGELLRPRIFQRIVTADGEEKPVRGREVLSRPLRPETTQIMTTMLETVVKEGGTGTLAASSEYRVAGKTGTAQKAYELTRGYANGKYFASFVGFAPVEEPRLVVYVGLDEPEGERYYGGQVAAPVFKRIVESSLRYLKVPSRHEPHYVDQPQVEEKEIDQNVSVLSAGSGKWKVPDFQGLTMRGVLKALGKSDLQVDFRGSGVAIQQTPAAGSVVASGTMCRVVFHSSL
ncbi:MAG: hypothetical protein A3I05_05855 [Deltaproteobacteria bacterium RIFCSPLOWO2_02_FULL_44_10]|nr:MAG: hypothetical protein A3C46_04680 [Deltaproteobacteria bacterium RIFCSPHIGHO2_02_FULL_44_16]OGQ46132.1 MAG: hypothetical protein A3I05_05855 [Deltaproteobacteria bacterium RIFCSPLOWO2_02_FULL_44_10]